ncbi:MAG: MAPEG family protein [Epsilonproteobacteria bacterium]|nr:MAG: MAPEG family protein [Campylobacterota bacterium]RLA64782.1 MAG: MAPEG family protein [Campylobacterota bacterium]
MSIELKYLTWISVATAFMWVPYILNAFIKFGLVKSMGHENRDAAMSVWAIRMKKAHANAIENLVIFAVLILVLNGLGISTEKTQCAAAVYFWARIAHFFLYAFGVPWLRTISFVVGWAATLSLACQILH